MDGYPHLYQVGTRLRFTADWDFYPLGSFPAGAAGSLIEVNLSSSPTEYIAILKMDDHFPALDEWDNTLIIYRPDHAYAPVTPALFEVVIGFG